MAEYRATLRRPISMDEGYVYVRYGLAAELVVPLTSIAAAAPNREPVARRLPGVLRYCNAGAPNVCIHLDSPLAVPNLLGDSRAIERIYLGVDAPAHFIERMNRQLAAVSRHK